MEVNPPNMGVSRHELRETRIGKYLYSRYLQSINKEQLRGDLTDDEYLESLIVSFFDYYQRYLSNGVHPVNAQEAAIEAVTFEFIENEPVDLAAMIDAIRQSENRPQFDFQESSIETPDQR